MQTPPNDPSSFLAKFNDFICLPSGVYASEKHPFGLSYSDGDAEEEYIYKAVSTAKDISSLSEELSSFERDWSSECHLSSKRANVFRALDFNGIHTILEVGSGCGAITRFLGEQGGSVDAVEGSLRRAEITRQRCRDLDNVSVIHADFNRLHLPPDHYDVAFLTGVLEYAGKYTETGQTAVDAAVAMLQRILDCLGPKGKLVVAIENRIGFKYLAGACEDHFSRPWVGICNYPECDSPQYKEKYGIETWDRSQWEEMLNCLQNVCCEWYYPFPDYKLATSLLSESFIQKSPFASSCLTRVKSRDYTAVWHPQIDEQLFWQTAESAGMLKETANSFVLVLQKEQEVDDHFVPFDFVHFSGQTRKKAYQITVLKKKGQPCVEKHRLFGHIPFPESEIISQHLATEPYYEGELLITHWLKSIKSCSSPVTLDKLLKEYYSYLLHECTTTEPGRLLDLLPMNIVVAPDGNWIHFDQEWQAQGEISPQFILFRTVLYLYWESKELLSHFCQRHNLSTGWKFVEYCLGRILYTDEIDIPSFVELENTIQRAISRSDAFAAVEDLLDSSPEQVSRIWSWKKSSLVWGAQAETSRPVTAHETDFGLNVVYTLPVEVCSSSFIQLHLGAPENLLGSVFVVHDFTFYGVDANGSRTCVFPTGSTSSLPSIIELTGISFYDAIRGGVYTIEDKSSQILHFAFPESITCSKSSFTSIECEVKIEFLPMTIAEVLKESCKLEKQNFDVAINELNQLVDEKIQEIVNRDKLIADKVEEIISRDNMIAAKTGEIHTLHGQVERLKHRLKEIEESRAWQIILKLRNLKKTFERFFEKEGRVDKNVIRQQDIEDSPSIVDPPVEKGTKKTTSTLTTGGVAEDDCEKTPSCINETIERVVPAYGDKISIVVATYNTIPAYLQETLQSVVSQSYARWEVVIVDSGSTNGATQKMLSEISHPGVKVHCPHKMDNLTQAMQEGAALATGDWLLFLGHYDRLTADALTALVLECVKKEADLFYWDERLIDRIGTPLDIDRKRAWDRTNLDQQHDIVGSSLCVHKDLFKKVGGLDHSFDGVQFLEFVWKAGKEGARIVHLREIISERRVFAPQTEEEQNHQHDLVKRVLDSSLEAS